MNSLLIMPLYYWSFAGMLAVAYLSNVSGALNYPSDVPSKLSQPCTDHQRQQGRCSALNDCPSAKQEILEKIKNSEPVMDILRFSSCGFDVKEPYVCCPTSELNMTPGSTDGMSLVPKTGFGGDPEEHPNLHLLMRDTCGVDYSDRILGGREAAVKQFPWMALLRIKKDDGFQTLCGGSLINERYVLTASHCFHRNPEGKRIIVFLGEHNILTDPDCQMSDDGEFCSGPVQVFGIEEIIRHLQYDGRTKVGDIALIRLNRTATITESVLPICLPAGGALNKTYEGAKLIVAGWGITEDDTSSDVKLWVRVPVVNINKCGEIFKTSLHETLMCAGLAKGEDSCIGDSGGPLMTVEEVVPYRPGSQWVAAAIVTAGGVCGIEGFPGIYTRVGPYMDWILDNLKP